MSVTRFSVIGVSYRVSIFAVSTCQIDVCLGYENRMLQCNA